MDDDEFFKKSLSLLHSQTPHINTGNKLPFVYDIFRFNVVVQENACAVSTSACFTERVVL
jgi:hypothetical protein